MTSKKISIALISAFILLIMVSAFLNGEETEGNTGKIKITGLYGSESSSGGSDPFSQALFIPGISFIMDFSYDSRDIENELFESLVIPGFIEHEDNGEEHHHGSNEKGFNLNYGELVLAATVDPYFDLMATFHLSAESFEIEEVYAATRRLPLGLKLKLGKFKSGFGRINEQHAHTWNFKEQPLIYQSFFGEEGLQELGVQLNWVAPVPFYLSFGLEALQGNNEASFGTEGFEGVSGETGDEFHIKDTPSPNLLVFNGKSSFDAGKWVFLGGVSCAVGKTRANHLEDEEKPHGFAGNTTVWGMDLTAKYIIDSYRSLSIQAEYLTRKKDGTMYYTKSQENLPDHSSFEKEQSGGYAEMIYRFHRLWRVGSRWDWLNRNRETENTVSNVLPENLNRYSFMVDYNPTEFSRIRFQYYIDRASFLGDVKRNNQGFSIQFNLAIGAHGAHAF